MPRVLIADDEPIVRQLLREILSIDPALSFVEAVDGAKALEAARAAYPQLIILDVMMPEMDGLEVCRRLKADAILRAIPVIIITAHFASDSEQTARQAGAEAFVRKPFDEEILLATVARLLQSPAA